MKRVFIKTEDGGNLALDTIESTEVVEVANNTTNVNGNLVANTVSGLQFTIHTNVTQQQLDEHNKLIDNYKRLVAEHNIRVKNLRDIISYFENELSSLKLSLANELKIE